MHLLPCNALAFEAPIWQICIHFLCEILYSNAINIKELSYTLVKKLGVRIWINFYLWQIRMTYINHTLLDDSLLDTLFQCCMWFPAITNPDLDMLVYCFQFLRLLPHPLMLSRSPRQQVHHRRTRPRRGPPYWDQSETSVKWVWKRQKLWTKVSQRYKRRWITLQKSGENIQKKSQVGKKERFVKEMYHILKDFRKSM